MKGVYHVMVSSEDPLQGTDSKLLFSGQLGSSSHNGGGGDDDFGGGGWQSGESHSHQPARLLFG